MMKNTDLAIFFGARINWMFNHGADDKWNPDCKYIQVDSCEEEFDSNVHIDNPILGDCSLTASLLLDELKEKALKIDTALWLSDIDEVKNINTHKLLQKVDYDKTPMSFVSAFFTIKKVMENHENLSIVNEGANTLDIGRMILPICNPRSRLDSGTWGTMGIGMPYAIAAAICNGNPVLAVEGDSAFGFSGMEIETICRYNLPVIVIIMNNGGIYKGDNESFYKDDPSPGSFIPNESYEKMIEAFGGDKYLIKNTKELEETLEVAISNRRPAILNCLIKTVE
ncbi:thiamine pyrophosphate-dependent enzyme [Francisella sp. 19S2-10]|nr:MULTISPECIES: thiamine pyrophosphate-dependent enzyme [unclassified Francisella]MED7820402.1 thiamine pyrophosphate-dependent enzyme [Francisella sp. 19S2-4]MED7831237.1 thiamine pyrophosphate-dependent enzyme [Francisella sp. 19S2-10]